MLSKNANQRRWSPHTDMSLYYMTYWLNYLTKKFENTLPIKKNMLPTIQTQLCSLYDPCSWNDKDLIWESAAHSATRTGYSISSTWKQIYAINISISWPSLHLNLSPQRSQAGNGTGQLIDRSPLYPESNSVPRFGDSGKAEAAQMRGKPPGL